MSRFSVSDAENSESRTSAVVSRRRVRRRDRVHVAASPSPDSSGNSAMGNAPSQSAHISTPQDSSEQANPRAADVRAMMTPNSAFGNNRLATGFQRVTSLAPVAAQGESDLNDPLTSTGGARNEVVEISDDEEPEESDEGGMLINIDSPPHQSLPVDMDLDDEQDKGRSVGTLILQSQSFGTDTPQSMSSTGRQAHTQLQGDLDTYLNSTLDTPLAGPGASASASQSVTRLADLDQEELALQVKYAFFDVDPNTLDLDQPAVCLNCLSAGHAERVCPEIICTQCSASHSSRLCPLSLRCSRCRERGHGAESCRSAKKVTTVPCDFCGALNHVEQTCPHRFFPANRSSTNGPWRLWISCSACASKDHLVGDCSNADQAMTARWSLKSYAPGSVININTGAYARAMEQEAANRGLRPNGLKIKGRASQHNAGAPKLSQQADAGDEDEQFLRPSVRSRDTPRSVNIAVKEKKPKRTSEPSSMPSKKVMTDFVAALNRTRKGQRKVGLIYAGSFPVIVDKNGSQIVSLFEDMEQRRVVWNWQTHGQDAAVKGALKTLSGDLKGHAYLVCEKSNKAS